MTVIITGGSGAIGAMCAYEFAKKGYDIVLCCNNNVDSANKVKQMLADFNVKIEIVAADITKKQDRQKICDASLILGGADILVNNAGKADISAFCDTDESDTERMLDINLSAHIDLTRKIIPQMLKKQNGAIVNISSVWGITGASCEVIYSAAKAGIIGFTKALAKELATSNITVNCVAPGCIESNMLGSIDRKELCEKIPLGKIGDGLDIARAVSFLACHGYITGQVLSVDGGMII